MFGKAAFCLVLVLVGAQAAAAQRFRDRGEWADAIARVVVSERRCDFSYDTAAMEESIYRGVPTDSEFKTEVESAKERFTKALQNYSLDELTRNCAIAAEIARRNGFLK